MTRHISKPDGTLRARGGRQIGYGEFGDAEGKPVILFHGYGDSRLTRHPDDELTARLGVRLITVDRPGIGLTDPMKELSLIERLHDIEEVTEALKIDRFAVLGWSGGGPFALAAAYEFGHYVTRAGIAGGFGPFERTGFRHLAPKEIRRVILILKAAPWMSGMLAKESAQQLESSRSSMSNGDGLASSSDSALLARGDVRDNIRRGAEEAFRQGHEGVAADMLLVFRFKWGFRPEDVSRPVDLWYGDEDRMTPVEVGRGLASLLPDARLRVSPGAGHLLHIRYWEDILQTLTESQPAEVRVAAPWVEPVVLEPVATIAASSPAPTETTPVEAEPAAAAPAATAAAQDPAAALAAATTHDIVSSAAGAVLPADAGVAESPRPDVPAFTVPKVPEAPAGPAKPAAPLPAGDERERLRAAGFLIDDDEPEAAAEPQAVTAEAEAVTAEAEAVAAIEAEAGIEAEAEIEAEAAAEDEISPVDAEAVETEAVEAEVVEAEVVEAQVVEAEVMEAEVVEAEVVEAEVVEAEAVEAEVPEPEAPEAGAVEPATAEAEPVNGEPPDVDVVLSPTAADEAALETGPVSADAIETAAMGESAPATEPTPEAGQPVAADPAASRKSHELERLRAAGFLVDDQAAEYLAGALAPLTESEPDRTSAEAPVEAPETEPTVAQAALDELAEPPLAAVVSEGEPGPAAAEAATADVSGADVGADVDEQAEAAPVSAAEAAEPPAQAIDTDPAERLRAAGYAIDDIHESASEPQNAVTGLLEEDAVEPAAASEAGVEKGGVPDAAAVASADDDALDVEPEALTLDALDAAEAEAVQDVAPLEVAEAVDVDATTVDAAVDEPTDDLRRADELAQRLDAFAERYELVAQEEDTDAVESEADPSEPAATATDESEPVAAEEPETEPIASEANESEPAAAVDDELETSATLADESEATAAEADEREPVAVHAGNGEFDAAASEAAASAREGNGEAAPEIDPLLERLRAAGFAVLDPVSPGGR